MSRRFSTIQYKGRMVCLDPEVVRWLRTGRGFVDGAGSTLGGSAERNLADLERALDRHIADEKNQPPRHRRYGMESKFETRDYTHDRQHFWLWLHTSQGHGIYPPWSISVTVDHG